MQFVTFEGGEGAGKTALIFAIIKKLEEIGEKVLYTREPGGVELAEKIRALLLDGTADLDAKTEVLLFAAARREHWVHKVKPALEDGVIVLCDRFIDSSMVYQGFVRGENEQMIKIINEYATDEIVPSQTFFLDVDPQEGLRRIMDNGREKNRIDEKDLEFHLMVQKGYRELCKQNPSRIIKINANKAIGQVEEDVWETFKKLIMR